MLTDCHLRFPALIVDLLLLIALSWEAVRINVPVRLLKMLANLIPDLYTGLIPD